MTDKVKPSYEKYLPMLVSNADEMGVVLTAEQLAPMLVGNTEFLKTLEEYYSKDHAADNYMDTQDRDTLGDCIALYLTGYTWPLNKSTQEFSYRFQKAMIQAAASGKIVSFGE